MKPWSNYRRDRALACEGVRIDAVTSNDLRRTFASWLVQRGVPFYTVAKLLGHSSTRMVEVIYGELSDRVLREAVDLLPVPTMPKAKDA